jgi:adenylate cyclase class 2
MEEIEVKFLNVDVKALEAKLAAIGASKSFERMYRRKVYDFPDLRLNAQRAWIRVRDEGEKVTMGCKQRKNLK